MMNEEAESFRQAHPGMDYEEERTNALVMASRRFTVRALGQVLPAYLDSPSLAAHGVLLALPDG